MENTFKVGDIVDWCEDGMVHYRIIEVWDFEAWRGWGRKVRIRCLEDNFEIQTYEKFIQWTPAAKVLYGQG